MRNIYIVIIIKALVCSSSKICDIIIVKGVEVREMECNRTNILSLKWKCMDNVKIWDSKKLRHIFKKSREITRKKNSWRVLSTCPWGDQEPVNVPWGCRVCPGDLGFQVFLSSRFLQLFFQLCELPWFPSLSRSPKNNSLSVNPLCIEIL